MFSRHFLITIPTLLSFNLVVTGNKLGLYSSPNNQPDNSDLLEWTAPENVQNAFPFYLSGYDYNNKPIIVLLWGKWDTRRIVEDGGQELTNLLRRNDQLFERIKRSYFQKRTNESEMGSGEDEVVFLIDYDGFDLRQVQSLENMRLVMAFFEKLESCYEKIAYGYIVNASSLVDGILNLGKILMGRFLERMEIHGTNSRQFIPHLLKTLPRSQISPTYGGFKDFKPIVFYG